MKSSFRIIRNAMSLSVATSLAACGGSQLPIGALGAMPRTLALAAQAARSSSWMLPEAKSDDLLYISDSPPNNGNVKFYKYPSGKLVGKLAGFHEPVGLCVDKLQDVFVINFAGTPPIVEYAHGGTTPIKTIDDPYGDPLGCAVDPRTGNLAVANYYPARGSAGNLVVYSNGFSKTTVYTDSAVYNFSFCTYDNQGNLYADGEPAHITGIVLAELPKGSAALTNITFRHTIGAKLAFPGALQWRGNYLAVGGGEYRHPTAEAIYHVHLHGFSGVILHETPLPGTKDPNGAQFWIQGPIVIAPSYHEYQQHRGKVRFYNYPSGSFLTTLTGHFDKPFGVAISLATH